MMKNKNRRNVGTTTREYLDPGGGSQQRPKPPPRLYFERSDADLQGQEEVESGQPKGFFQHFCQTTSLHGWKFLSSTRRARPLLFGWSAVVAASIGVAAFFLSYSVTDFLSSAVQTTQDTSRGSLQDVFFPSVTLCNINQGRNSLFRQVGLSDNEELLHAVLRQAYLGLTEDLSEAVLKQVRDIFSSREVVRKGLVTDVMFGQTAYRGEAFAHLMESAGDDSWLQEANQTYIRDAGWFFKTLAVQEIGENFVLSASYRRVSKDTNRFTNMLPFFGTDYGLCTLIKPQITFDPDLDEVPFVILMKNFTKSIRPGIQLGKENGLSILLDTETYDYGYSPQRGEGFKLAVHHHRDQPIMALSDVDISPGFVTQLSVTPTLTVTTQEARERFQPWERKCYFDEEFRFKYLPSELYRYGLSNCLFAATHDKILSECGCVPFFHTLAFEDYPVICSGRALTCMNAILRDIGSHTQVEDHEGVQRPCYSPCTDQSNKMAVTTSVFPNLNTFSHGPEFCVLLRKLKSTCSTYKRATLAERYPGLCELVESSDSDAATSDCDLTEDDDVSRYLSNPSTIDQHDKERLKATVLSSNNNKAVNGSAMTKDKDLVSVLYKYARENLALVNIYIKDPAVTKVKRDQRVPVIWFIANVGGILGLTMGCSLVTVFEIVHHVLIVFLHTGKRSVDKLNRSVTVKLAKANSHGGDGGSSDGSSPSSKYFHDFRESRFQQIHLLSRTAGASGGSLDRLTTVRNHLMEEEEEQRRRKSQQQALIAPQVLNRELAGSSVNVATIPVLRMCGLGNGSALQQDNGDQVCSWT